MVSCSVWDREIAGSNPVIPNNFGRLREWLKRIVLKTIMQKCIKGSNPLPSANLSRRLSMINILEKVASLEKAYRLNLAKIEAKYGYIPIFDKVCEVISNKQNLGFTSFDWCAEERDIIDAFKKVIAKMPK